MLPALLSRRRFSDLSEQEIIALAISSEEDDGRIYRSYAERLRAEFPDRKKIPHRELPAFVVRLMSIFDRSLKSVTSDLGVVPVADSAYVTNLTGVEFRSAEEAVRSAGRSLVEFGLVD